jgi:TRAP-type C4-dicarboxylate transport system substrate-binding protein
MRIATVLSEEGNGWDDPVGPSPIFPFKEQVEEESGGDITVNLVTSGQLCGEEDCAQSISDGVLNFGHSSLPNTSKIWPDQNIWALPFMFESGPMPMVYATLHEETWEKYWIPFAREYGVVPFIHDITARRITHLQTDEDVSDSPGPDILEDKKIRTTATDVYTRMFKEWGANPVNVPISETLQGLQSGTVDGMEQTLLHSCAFGFMGSVNHSILAQFGGDSYVVWASVDELKQLSEEKRNILANVSKSVSNDMIHRLDSLYEAAGWPPDHNPSDDSCVVSKSTPHFYTEEQLQEWKDPVDPQQNRDLYDDIIGNNEIGTWDVYEHIWETSRENAVPDSSEDYNIDVWWDDYIDEI